MRSYPIKPDYYLYQKDGVWFKTDSSATKAISERIFAHRGTSLPKVEYIPNWKARGLENGEYLAWKVNRNGEIVVRWYWKVGEHSKKCGRCVRLGGGRCAIKAPAAIEWNKAANSWSLRKMQDKASEDEAKILDKGGRNGD
jgi:hypothetical protein